MINDKKRGMYPIQLTILPPPAILKSDVECVRIAEYSGGEAVAIKVAPTGLPGMVFHQSRGQAALEQIVTDSGRTSCPPPLFLYGPVIEPSVMTYTRALRGLSERGGLPDAPYCCHNVTGGVIRQGLSIGDFCSC